MGFLWERAFEPSRDPSIFDRRSSIWTGATSLGRGSTLRASETPSGCFVWSTGAGYRLRRGGASISVANISNATDALGAVRQVSEFSPQIADVDIDASIERRIFVVQDLLQEFFSMNHASTATQEQRQQIKLGCRQFDSFSVPAARSRTLVDREVTHFEIFRFRCELARE